MTHPRWRVGALAALAVALVGLAGCAGDDGGAAADTSATPTTIPFEWSGTAATVNGTPIPAQVIADQVAAFSEAPEAVRAALGDVPDLYQPGTEHPQPVIVADLLQTEIMVHLIRAELAERGITPSEDQRRIAANNVKTGFGTATGQLPEPFVAELEQRYAEYVALDMALNPEPPEEELQAAYRDEPQKWERVCARHVLVTDEAEAQAVLDELRGGADFAEVASTRSQDKGTAPSGGDLGCFVRGETTGGFEEALWSGPVGELQGPITSEVGIHVLEVTSRGVPPYEEARAAIVADQQSAPFTQLGAWVTVRAVRSDISVDARYGTWDSSVGKVLPVGGGADGLTLTPGPGGPAGSEGGERPGTTEAPAPTPTTAGVIAPSTTAAAGR